LNFFKPIKVYFSKHKELSQYIKNIFGFYPGNIFLYTLAFRHKSVTTEAKNSNERLEYLGDAVLSAVTADYLFKKFPLKDEGFLTEMRSKIVSRASLNKLSEKLGITKMVQFNQDSNNHYRSMPGDAFEAFIGAVYLDKGYIFTKRLITEKIIQLHLDIDDLETKEVNFKSKMIEWAQKEKKTLEFLVVDEIGNGYKKLYAVEILIDGIAQGRGEDYSIKKAEQRAAENAYNSLISPV
jgi:ribonuclease III